MTPTPRTPLRSVPRAAGARWLRRRGLTISLPFTIGAALLALASAAAGSGLPVDPRVLAGTWPADSLRPGMVGISRSVFQGTRLDTFSVTILGVLRGTSPGGDLILGRAQGSYLEHTGIIAGMSGSPVYVEGRLIGAIAFAFPFAKEPIAGITPIREMLRDLTAPPPGEPRGDESRYGAADPEEEGADAAGFDASSLVLGPLGRSYPGGAEPIATPIAFSGFSPDAIRYLEPWLAQRGLVASPGGGGDAGGSCDSIVPGAAVGVQLIRGDWSATAIGTVTHRDGDRVLAFGHPFFSLGRTQLPMTAMTVHAVLPTQQVSIKFGGATRSCGTVDTDRGVGIAGRIGAPPSMIPVRVGVQGPEGLSRSYRFEVARSRFLTPGLVAAAVVNSVSGALFDVGTSTTRFDVAYHLDAGAHTLRRGNAFVGGGPTAGIGEDVNQTLVSLFSNRFATSRLDSVRFDVSIAPGLEKTTLVGIHVTPSIVAPGDSVEVELALRPAREAPITRRVRLRVPAQTPPGELSVRVCDGPETDRWERERASKRYEPQSYEHYLELLGARRRSDRFYVQLHRAAAGAAVRGGEMSQAPASVLEVLGANLKAGETEATRGATLEERELRMEHPVDGCESTTITVLPYRAR